jgi:hypothetical protein
MQLKKGHSGQGEIQARRANGEKDGRTRGLWMRCHPRTTVLLVLVLVQVLLAVALLLSLILLPLSSKSSDHTLMHVVRPRIQTRWQAANRREPHSDPRSFHQQVSAMRSVTASFQRHLPFTIVFFTDRDDAYPPRMPSPQSPSRIGQTALM